MMMTSSVHCSPTWRNNSYHLPNTPKCAPLCLLGKSTNQTKFPFSHEPGFGFAHRFGFCGSKLQFCMKAKGAKLGGEEGKSREEEEKELEELRGTSTMPDRFRYLTKEAPSKPLRWPWFVASAFLIYAWRSVLWELTNWRKVVMGIFQFVGYLLKLVVALIFYFIGDPITYTIFYIETTLHAVRSFYSSIVTSAPISELTLIIMLASTVLAIGEAASPNSVNQQPYLITAAGIIGYLAVKGIISEPVFWLSLFGIFSFARFIMKRDDVSSALPAATVLAAVGEPWVRLLSIISFTALAIHRHSKTALQGKEAVEAISPNRKVPFPLLAVALAIGLHLAAKWAGYRHLTWMIV